MSRISFLEMATQHRGEILKHIIRQTGLNQTRLARMLGISRSTLYRQYEVPNLSLVFIQQVGEAIGYDFAPDVRGLVARPGVAAEPAAPYAAGSLAECQVKLLRVHELLLEKAGQYDELKARYEVLLAERKQ